jgi:molybdopterin/thiamine biosynthesis adenylyltransferase
MVMFKRSPDETARIVHDRTMLFVRTAIRWPGGQPPTEEAVRAALPAFPVLLTGSRAYLETEAGQAAALLGANLLARLFPALQVDVPADIRLRAVAPFAVITTAGAVYPWGHAMAQKSARGVLVLGTTDGLPLPSGPAVVCAAGEGWWVRVGHPAMADGSTRNPFGAMVSAALAAMELYKAFLRTLLPTGADPGWDLAAAEPHAFSLLDYGRAGTGYEMDPLPAGLDLGEVAFVSAGAMAHATLYGLLAAGAAARGSVSEPKDVDEPDLNRYLLAGGADLGEVKARLFATRAAPEFALEWEVARYQDSAARARRRADGRPVPLMLVGVDHPPSRIEAQRDRAEVLINGATEQGELCVSRHPASDPDLPCLECITPDEEPGPDPIPTIGPVSAVAGLLLAVEAVKERVPTLVAWRLRGAVWVSVLRADSRYAVRTSVREPRDGCACRGRTMVPAAA